MKKQNLFTTLKVSITLFTLTFSMNACNQVSKEAIVENEEKAFKVEAPATDIHTAAFMGNVGLITQHIQAGTDLDKKNQFGSTPLNTAITFGKTDAAKALIEAGVDINKKNSDGATPLHIAAFFCRADIVEVLLSKEADKSLKNNFGSTALETVSVPFKEIKPFYIQIKKDLAPLGLNLDLNRIEEERPTIAELISLY